MTIADDEFDPTAICDGCGFMQVDCACDDLAPMPNGTDFHDDD